MSSLAAFLRLARFSNIPTVWTNVLAAWGLGGGSFGCPVMMLCLAGSLLYAGGCTLNDAFDADWDRKHRPERPIPSGTLSPRSVWAVGSFEMLAGLGLVAWLFVGALTSALLLALWILLYDWAHKKSAWAVVLMAGCRLQLAWTAALGAGRFGDWNRLHAAGLFAYILIITIIARKESRVETGNVSGFRIAALLLAVPVLLAPVALVFDRTLFVNWAAWVGVGLSTLCSLAAARLLAVRGRAGIGAFVSLALAGITLFDSAFAAATWGWRGLLLAAFLPLCLLLQRKFAAT